MNHVYISVFSASLRWPLRKGHSIPKWVSTHKLRSADKQKFFYNFTLLCSPLGLGQTISKPVFFTSLLEENTWLDDKLFEFPQLPFSQCLNALWAPWLSSYHPLRKIYLSSCPQSTPYSMLFNFLGYFWPIPLSSISTLCFHLTTSTKLSPNLKLSHAPSLLDKWLLRAVYFPLVT